MIRIRKPSEPPSILLEQGLASREQLCRRVDEDANAKLSFDRGIYGADEVKAVLRAAQHDKCCFCEAKVSPVAFGDVEHFRPKAAVRQSVNDPEIRRGYYWLAYTWNNLFLACEVCNRKYKSTLFPLAVRLAPNTRTVSTTVGWLQQFSAFGQFAGPPIVAYVASAAGGWQWTWVVTGGASVIGLVFTGLLARLMRRPARAH